MFGYKPLGLTPRTLESVFQNLRQILWFWYEILFLRHTLFHPKVEPLGVVPGPINQFYVGWIVCGADDVSPLAQRPVSLGPGCQNTPLLCWIYFHYSWKTLYSFSDKKHFYNTGERHTLNLMGLFVVFVIFFKDIRQCCQPARKISFEN